MEENHSNILKKHLIITVYFHLIKKLIKYENPTFLIYYLNFFKNIIFKNI